MTRTCRWHRPCPEKASRGGYCEKHWSKLYRANRAPAAFVDATPVRERIAEYLTRGGSYRSLAKLSRTCSNRLTAVHAGKTTRIRVGVADRVMAVPLRPSNVGCVRRVNALTSIGHTIPTIATKAGCTADTLYKALERARFLDATAHGIVVAYEQLSNTRGVSRAAVTWTAHRADIAPPMAWEGIDIDDPDTAPDVGPDVDGEPFDEAMVLRFMTGEISGRDIGGGARKNGVTARLRAARDEAIHRFTQAGYSAWWISKQIGCMEHTVEDVRARQRAGVNEQDGGTSEEQRAS
jgi:hypothetical protein